MLKCIQKFKIAYASLRSGKENPYTATMHFSYLTLVEYCIARLQNLQKAEEDTHWGYILC